MKNILVFFVFVFVFAFTFLQSYGQSIGIGPDLLFKTTRTTNGSESVNFYGIGCSVAKFQFKRFFFQTGLNYMMSTQTFPERDVRYNYLAIPLSVNFLVFNKKGLNLVLIGGGELDWLYRTKYKIVKNSQTSVVKVNSAINKYTLDLGIFGGLGAYLPIKDRITLLLKVQLNSIDYGVQNEIQVPLLSSNLQLLRRF